MISEQSNRMNGCEFKRELPRLVCHGSRVVVETPRILKARYTKDFGPGFYCTVLREQAVRWAVRFTGRGWLSHFEYRPDNGLDVLVFPQMSEVRGGVR